MNARWKKPLAIIVVIALIIAAVFSMVRSRPVEVVTAEREDETPIEVFGLGTVEARVLSRVGFAVAGTLQRVVVDHGDRVAAGDMLARLDSAAQSARVTKMQAALAQAEAARGRAVAQITRAEALLKQRRETRARYDTLVRKGSVSKEAAEDARTAEQVAAADLTVARRDVEVADAAIADARAASEIERVLLDQHELRAPYDAVVVERLREPGAVLNPGEAMFILADPASVWVLAYVDETLAGGLAPGQSAKIRLRSLPQHMFDAVIARIGIESDRVSEERRVYLDCMHCPAQFHLGEQVEVFITQRIVGNALLIPQMAVLGAEGSDGRVWTVEAGRLQGRDVRVGDRTLDGRIEILSGLEAGMEVVAAPVAGLREGKRVRTVERVAP
jgi:HlyD family secretion protein